MPVVWQLAGDRSELLLWMSTALHAVLVPAMSDYTPTTEEVRQRANSDDGCPTDVFDRWLAEHDAEVLDLAEQIALGTDFDATQIGDARAQSIAQAIRAHANRLRENKRPE